MSNTEYDRIHDIYRKTIVGRFKDFEISLYEEEKITTPHIHVKNNKTEEEYFIQLEKVDYFVHSAKEAQKLSDENKKDLVNWLSSHPYERFKEATGWDFVTMCWNMNNPENEIPEDLEIPDYTKLN